jgi:hypothetical protein
MSKKNKRQYRKETTPSINMPVSSSPISSASGKGAFNPDYTYVVKDLRRIGALAGSFILILIVLSFILR